MTTHWSVLRELADDRRAAEPEKAQEMLAQLCQDYWPPLYGFVRRRGYNREDAKDLTQGFFEFLLEKEVYAAPDQSKGRFRTFLLVLLKRYLGAAHAHQRRQKRGGGQGILSLDAPSWDIWEGSIEEALSTDAPLDEQRAFEWNWAAALVNRAMEALRAEYSGPQREQIFTMLRPFLSGGVGLPTYEQAAAQLHVPSETLRSHLFRLRSRYRALLRAEVARTVPSDEDVESELNYLCRVLIASA